jgi:hypothetical protein
VSGSAVWLGVGEGEEEGEGVGEGEGGMGVVVRVGGLVGVNGICGVPCSTVGCVLETGAGTADPFAWQAARLEKNTIKNTV